MPRIHGLNHGHIPVVIVSALDSEECRRRGFEAGADAYFAKPFDPDEVIHAIQALIETNHVAARKTAGP